VPRRAAILRRTSAAIRIVRLLVPSRMITFPLGDLPCSWQDRC
jgi:hypothetical protein